DDSAGSLTNSVTSRKSLPTRIPSFHFHMKPCTDKAACDGESPSGTNDRGWQRSSQPCVPTTVKSIVGPDPTVRDSGTPAHTIVSSASSYWATRITSRGWVAIRQLVGSLSVIGSCRLAVPPLPPIRVGSDEESRIPGSSA